MHQFVYVCRHRPFAAAVPPTTSNLESIFFPAEIRLAADRDLQSRSPLRGRFRYASARVRLPELTPAPYLAEPIPCPYNSNLLAGPGTRSDGYSVTNAGNSRFSIPIHVSRLDTAALEL